jgi:hypothetical protein
VHAAKQIREYLIDGLRVGDHVLVAAIGIDGAGDKHGDDGPTRKKKGLRALECIRRGREIKGVIFNASVQYPRHIEELPTWVATKGIEDELRRSEIPFSVATYSIASAGVLAYPISEPHAFAWTSADDVARLIDHVWRHNFMGASVLAGGKRALNGAELARCFSEGLGSQPRASDGRSAYRSLSQRIRRPASTSQTPTFVTRRVFLRLRAVRFDLLHVFLVQQTLSPIRSCGADRQRRAGWRTIHLVGAAMRSSGRDVGRRRRLSRTIRGLT